MDNENITISPYDTPWEIACILINAKRTTHAVLTQEEVQVPAFEKEELKRIGEHLVNYCKTEEKD